MRNIFLSLLFFLIPFSIQASTPDRTARAYIEQPKKFRVDSYDFSGVYPHLENIDINARKKKHVKFDLTGEYPVLETIDYEGSFGLFDGKLTGFYPNLRLVTFAMTNALIDLDLRGKWQRSCEINISGQKRDITLYLPKDVGVKVIAHTGVRGAVHPGELKKKGWFSFLKKTYENALVDSSDVVLQITVASTEGHIYLK